LAEGASKNSIKTGKKQGKKSKEAQKIKRKRDAVKIREARTAAEAQWGTLVENGICKLILTAAETYLVTTAPGELVHCRNTAEATRFKLWKYNLDSSGYISKEGTISVPCPPLFFDANTERTYIADIENEKIFAGIKPLFLIQKFANVLSKNGAETLQKRWTAFKKTNPIPQKTASARSSSSESFHLGIWRRRKGKALVTADTRWDDEHQQKRCLDFMRAVKDYIAPQLKRLMERYTKDEWVLRQQ